MDTPTRLVPLTQGQSAIVDEIDYEWLMQHKWHAHKTPRTFGFAWRAMRTGKSHQMIWMHQEIAKRAGLGKIKDYDHVDANGLNNTRKNIRPCTRSQNNMNMRKRSGCTSRFKGVYWHRTSQTWHARITILGVVKSLRYFHSEEKAALAYNEAAKSNFGEFARLNPV